MPYVELGKLSQQQRRRMSAGVTFPEKTPDAPFAPVFAELSRDELSSRAEGEHPRITETQTIACFNWLGERNPHIIIPGMPPKWTPLGRPQKLREDTGIYYRDRNAAHYPDNPMEPTVEAILRTSPPPDKAVSGRIIDVFGCGSTLGNLLRFVQGTHKTFRILVETVGSTVHLIRREKSPLETIPDVRGYGHTFPESYTTWDACSRGSSSHQRIIQYQLGGLTCLVRFEGDGYFSDKVGDKTNGRAAPKNKKETTTLDDLSSPLSVSGTTPALSKAALTISEAGCLVPQRAVFDIKTRSNRRKLDQVAVIAGELPRLWLRQIPTLVLAYHTAGVFHDIQIRDVRGEVAEWEEENKDGVARLVAILERIVDVARERGGGRLEITCQENGSSLCFRAQTADTKPAFTKSTENRWKAWLGHDSTADGVTAKMAGDEEAEGRHVDDGTPDYTACDEECGYCRQCEY